MVLIFCDSSSVIDTLQKDPKWRLAFFYFENGDPTKLDCLPLLSSLGFQIGKKSEKGISYLKGESRSSDHLDYAKLLELLSHLLCLSGPTVIVIDALDECPERERKLVFSFLKRLHDLQGSTDVHVDLRVLITSRPEADIKSYVLGLCTHRLDINKASEHTEDIQAFISKRLFSDDSKNDYPDWTDEIKWGAFNTLSSKSNGMYVDIFYSDMLNVLTMR